MPKDKWQTEKNICNIYHRKKIDIRKNKEPLKTEKKRQTMEMNKYCPKKEIQINSF